MAKKMNVDYDYENDILYLYSGEKVKDSLQIDKYILDFSPDEKIVAIEILDASKILGKLSEINITKDMLSKIEHPEMSIYQSKELIYVILSMRLSMDEREIDLKIPFSAPATVAASA